MYINDDYKSGLYVVLIDDGQYVTIHMEDRPEVEIFAQYIDHLYASMRRKKADDMLSKDG